MDRDQLNKSYASCECGNEQEVTIDGQRNALDKGGFERSTKRMQPAVHCTEQSGLAVEVGEGQPGAHLLVG